MLGSIVDLGLFDPNNCVNIKHCIVSDSGYIMFVLDDTDYVGINLVPNDTTQPMQLLLGFRLINDEEKRFMN